MDDARTAHGKVYKDIAKDPALMFLAILSPAKICALGRVDRVNTGGRLIGHQRYPGIKKVLTRSWRGLGSIIGPLS